MRAYKLPEKSPDETNEAWCDRAAASIPADEIVRQMIAYANRHPRNRPVWSWVGKVLGHGSGVSSAIVRRFYKGDEP